MYRILKVIDSLQSFGKGYDTPRWKHYTNSTIYLPVWEWNLQQPNITYRKSKGSCSRSHISGMRMSVLSGSLNLLECVSLRALLQYSVTCFLQYHRTELKKWFVKTSSSFRKPEDHSGSCSQTVNEPHTPFPEDPFNIFFYLRPGFLVSSTLQCFQLQYCTYAAVLPYYL